MLEPKTQKYIFVLRKKKKYNSRLPPFCIYNFHPIAVSSTFQTAHPSNHDVSRRHAQEQFSPSLACVGAAESVKQIKETANLLPPNMPSSDAKLPSSITLFILFRRASIIRSPSFSPSCLHHRHSPLRTTFFFSDTLSQYFPPPSIPHIIITYFTTCTTRAHPIACPKSYTNIVLLSHPQLLFHHWTALSLHPMLFCSCIFLVRCGLKAFSTFQQKKRNPSLQRFKIIEISPACVFTSHVRRVMAQENRVLYNYSKISKYSSYLRPFNTVPAVIYNRDTINGGGIYIQSASKLPERHSVYMFRTHSSPG